jgi:hypothetical protein
MALVLAFMAAGCGAPVALQGAPVALHTVGPDESSCYLSAIEGELVTDPAYGTSIVEAFSSTPVLWPDGYAGRQSGTEVEILDRSGSVVARTGVRYHLGGGYQGPRPSVWLACTMSTYALDRVPSWPVIGIVAGVVALAGGCLWYLRRRPASARRPLPSGHDPAAPDVGEGDVVGDPGRDPLV